MIKKKWMSKDYYNNKLGNRNNSKKVNQYSKKGIFIKTWDSISDVNRELGIDNSSISKVCKDKDNYNSAGGYIWKYLK